MARPCDDARARAQIRPSGNCRALLPRQDPRHCVVARRGASLRFLAMADDAAPSGKRERKQISAFVPQEVAKEKADLVVPEGDGEKLGDIENVKIKIDKLNGGSEELKALHRLCFGRVGKSTTCKKFLRDFCGFGADENMEKKEETIFKLDGKMIKSLLTACDLSTSGTKARRRCSRCRRRHRYTAAAAESCLGRELPLLLLPAPTSSGAAVLVCARSCAAERQRVIAGELFEVALRLGQEVAQREGRREAQACREQEGACAAFRAAATRNPCGGG
jgi:hypothetical protein